MPTCVSLRPGLAGTCIDLSDLRWLTFALVEIKFARESTQIFSPFGHPTKSTQVLLSTSSTGLYIARVIALKCFFFDNLRALAIYLASQFGQPTQACMQVQLATTSVQLRLCLAGAQRRSVRRSLSSIRNHLALATKQSSSTGYG